MTPKILLASLGFVSVAAIAQSALATQDVVVMRRTLTKAAPVPNPTPTVTPTPAPGGTPTPTPAPEAGSWVITGYGNWSSGCSETATRTVTAECRNAENLLPDSACSAEPKPNQETGPNLVSCQFDWLPGEWENWSSTCSTSAIRYRQFTCYRSDGQLAPGSCNEPAPTEQEGPTQVSSGCTVDWNYGNWSSYSSSCSNTATRTRSYTCTGYVPPSAISTGFQVDESRCTTTPDASQTVGRYTGCATQEALSFSAVAKNATASKTVSGLQVGSNYVLTLTANMDSDNQFDSGTVTISAGGTTLGTQTYRSRYHSPSTYTRTIQATGTSLTITVRNNSTALAVNFSDSKLSLVRVP